MKRIALAIAVTCLTGCSPSAPAGEAASAAPPTEQPVEAAADYSKPPEGFAESFPGCTWSEVIGAGPDSAGKADIVRSPVVQLFDIAEGADMASILPAVRAASPAPGNAECVFVDVAELPGWQEFRPTGELLAKYQLFIDGKADDPVQPCGELGPSEGGFRYFARLPGSATKVAVLFMPSDIPSFAMKSIKAAA